MKDKGDLEQTGEGEIDLLRQVAESAEDVFFIVDENRSVRFINRTLQAPARFPQPGRRFDGLVSAGICEALSRSTDLVFKSGRSLSIEHHLGAADHGIWLHTLLTPITNGSARVSSILGIARDITELKRKEKLIADSRAEWLQAVDAMPHLLAVIDLNYRIKKANKALADHLGVCLQDLHGRICHQTLGIKCPPELCPVEKSRSIGHDSGHFQSNILECPFLITVSSLTNESGNTAGCLFVALDLNGHPSDEELRKKNAEEMKSLFEQADYVVTIKDRNGKYISISALPGNIRLQEAIIGKTPFDFFEAKQAEKICELTRKAIRAGREITTLDELNIEGEIFHLLVHILPLSDETGNVGSAMAILKRIEGVAEKSKPMPNDSEQLTMREQEILQSISAGLTTSQIAEKLFISRKTVETHRSRIMRKLGIHKTSALVRYAVKSGLF